MSRRLLAGLALLYSTSSWAADIPAELQVELQNLMLNYIDSIAPDGAYTYVDTENDGLKTVYPANVHPIIVPMGDDYFVCSEMIDEEGNSLTADFLVRRIDGEYRIVQTIMDDREAVMAAIAESGG